MNLVFKTLILRFSFEVVCLNIYFFCLKSRKNKVLDSLVILNLSQLQLQLFNFSLILFSLRLQLHTHFLQTFNSLLERRSFISQIFLQIFDLIFKVADSFSEFQISLLPNRVIVIIGQKWLILQ